MEAEIEAHFNSALANASQDMNSGPPSTSQTPAPQDPLPSTADLNLPSSTSEALSAEIGAPVPEVVGSPTVKTAGGKNRKPRPTKAPPVVPGSSADFRRREANRLAAERSRSRQHEKSSIIENASKVLSEENTRLREQIAALEGTLPELQRATDRLEQGEAGDVLAGDEEVQESSHTGPINSQQPPQVDQTHDSDGGVDHRDHSHDHATTQEQEAHSHTILAALTDITGVDFSEGNEASWMQGMESFLKESDASGRLGELAAVATGEEEDAPSALDPSLEEEMMNRQALTGPQRVKGGLSRFRSDNPNGGPTSNAVILLATAINTEMERIIMEDLADTKAAIVKIEKQLAALRGDDGAHLSAEETEVDSASSLPTLILSNDADELAGASSEVQQKITRIQSALPGLHEELVKLRDEKTAEEDRMLDVIKEVQELDLNGNAEDKAHFMQAVKATSRFALSLLSDGHDQPDFSYASGTYSSPAIAPRRRGRPPKGDVSRTFYQSFLVLPSQASSSSRPEATKPKEKVPKVTKAKTVKATRKSRLSHRVRLAEGEKLKVERDLRQIQAQAQAQEREQEQEQAHSQEQIQAERDNQVESTHPISQAESRTDNAGGSKAIPGPTGALPESNDEGMVLDPAQLEGQHVVDHNATAEAVHRAEAYFLSQLASQSQDPNNHGHNHEHEHEGEHGLPPLDSNSFADFLPAQEELERQASAGVSQGQGQGHAGLDVAQIQAQAQAQAQAHVQALLSSHNASSNITGCQCNDPNHDHNTVPALESVLARLRKGPPGSCDICMRTETTVWRRLLLGDEDLKVCNACGTYHHKFGVIRPPELWDDGKSIRRRRAGPRPSAVSGEGTASGAEGAGDSDERPKKKAKRGRKPRTVTSTPFLTQSQTQPIQQTQAEGQKASPGLNHAGDDLQLQQGMSDQQVNEIGQDGLTEEGRRAVLDVALIQELGAMEAREQAEASQGQAEAQAQSLAEDHEDQHQHQHQEAAGNGLIVGLEHQLGEEEMHGTEGVDGIDSLFGI